MAAFYEECSYGTMKPVDQVEASPAARGGARDRRIWQVYFLVTVVFGLFLHYVFGVSRG